MKKSLVMLLVQIFAFGILSFGQNAVLIPDTISGTNFNLTLQNGSVSFYAGTNTETMGVNGNILGPTLIMQKGDSVNLLVNNNLNETTTMHWHGMHVSSANDGGPHTTIDPSSSWNPTFTVRDRAGTYWYHPHLHEHTNKHVSKGIAGFIIVRDNDEAALSLPRSYGIDDFPLVIQTKDFDNLNQIVVPSNSDDVLMVNATINPVLEVPAQVIRFRLLNGSSQRVFNIGLEGNQTFYQIGSDDGLLSQINPITRLQLAPGERVEILVNFTGMNGQSLNLMSYASEFQNGIYGATSPGMMSMMTLDGYSSNSLNGTDFNIIQFNITTQTPNPVITLPSNLVTITPHSETAVSIIRTLVFTPETMGQNQLNGNFLINGDSFDMNVFNYTSPINSTEIWSITNQSAIAHPFHIHNAHFYILDRDGSLPPMSERGRKDVVLIKPMENIRFITKFTDFANDSIPYMYHCHMLTHEDNGMMGQFRIIDSSLSNPEVDQLSDEIVVFPNPILSNTFRVESPESIISLQLCDIYGRQVKMKYRFEQENIVLVEMSHVVAGTYFIIIENKSNTFTKKIIK